MPDNSHRVRYTPDGIELDLTQGDEANILYLDVEEARSVAAILESQIMHTESCDGVAILEAMLTAAEAQVLASQLDNILLEASYPRQHQVKWQQEGF